MSTEAIVVTAHLRSNKIRCWTLHLAAASLLVGCGGGEPFTLIKVKNATYIVDFVDDSTQQYTPSSACGLYCRKWIPSSRAITGTLRITDLHAVLTADGQDWAGDWPGSDATLKGVSTVEVTLPTVCGGFRITLATNATLPPATGTFREIHDCHGRESAGRATIR